MKVFKQKHHLYKSIILSLSVVLLFASCKTEAEFDGDILSAIEADTSSIISFKKDKDSPVAFVKAYKIGKNYTAADLPGNSSAEVRKMYPGYDVTGWALDDSDIDLQDIITLDEDGCVKEFHMGVRGITLYGAGYQVATDTPYKVVFKTQNKTLDGYEYHSELNLEGTTSIPEAPSYTDATNNLKEIPGFTVRMDSFTETEILADGSAVVEVLYDRNEYTLTLHKNDAGSSGSAGSGTEETQQIQFYYDVPKALPANPFTYTGATFEGWAKTLDRASAGTVDYADGANYTIGAGDADLYAVTKALPKVSVSVELPGLDEVGVEHSLSGNTLTLTAKLPDGAVTSDYTYTWFYTDDGFGNVKCTEASWTVNTSDWLPGYYQITLIAERVSDGMPSGTTIQIHKE